MVSKVTEYGHLKVRFFDRHLHDVGKIASDRLRSNIIHEANTLVSMVHVDT